MKKSGYYFIFLLALVACGSRKNETKVIKTVPPNIIFFIGDGMGLAQISLAMHGMADNLVFNQCKNIGFIKTAATDDDVTDSAAGATAFSIGQKTKNGVLGMDSNLVSRQTIMEWAALNGWSTGIVATCNLTHATPAAFYAHQPSRKLDSQIAVDFYGKNIDLAIGGGKPFFSEEKLKANGYDIIIGTQNIEKTNSNKFVGFFNDSFSMPAISQGRGNFLPIVTAKSIAVLSNKKKPFFLMVEGSQIDWGGHDNNAQYIKQELIDFNEAIQQSLNFLANQPNTLILVTADHETGGLALNSDKKGKIIPAFTTGSHTGIMVPVFAFGKNAQLFNGIYENTAIYHKMMWAMKH